MTDLTWTDEPPDLSEPLETRIKAEAGVCHRMETMLDMEVIDVLQEAAIDGTSVTCGTDTRFRVTVLEVKHDPVDNPDRAHVSLALKSIGS